MKLISLTVRDFRNLEEVTFSPAQGTNLILGENAQGKTNLLESIWMFSGQRSFRARRESELIRFSQPFFRLEATFFDGEREQTAEIAIGEKKLVTKNGIKQKSLSQLSGEFPMVVFSPEHLSLIKDGPAERRRFLDSAIGQLYPDYTEALLSYQKALAQRNALLPDLRQNSSLYSLLEVWDQTLANWGGRVMLLRGRYCNRLLEAAAAFYEGISSGREAFSIAYQPSVEIEGDSEKELRTAFLKALEKTRREDIQTGVTGVGPHRDELLIALSGNSARQFGSQGQQRSCVLALKLGEGQVLRSRLEREPIVLLDDVMSELDSGRKQYLAQQLTGRQVLITCCESGIVGEKVFLMEGGRLTQQDLK